MSIIHLSDADIQEYLDTNSNKVKVESHIMACEECAILVAEYQSFYTTLSQEQQPELSANFMANTMHAVHEEAVRLEKNGGFYLYSFFSLVSAFLFLKYYAGISFEFFTFKMPHFVSAFTNWSLLHDVSTYYRSSSETVNMVLVAGIVLLTVALADKIISRVSSKQISSLSL